MTLAETCGSESCTYRVTGLGASTNFQISEQMKKSSGSWTVKFLKSTTLGNIKSANSPNIAFIVNFQFGSDGCHVKLYFFRKSPTVRECADGRVIWNILMLCKCVWRTNGCLTAQMSYSKCFNQNCWSVCYMCTAHAYVFSLRFTS